ncbi:MAG: DUF507 family protein [Polyangiaceae bacterium]|nr:DUF507 family protein [Polyangiaceae bacterium]
MRLPAARIPQIAAEIVSALTSAQAIEAESLADVRADVEAVLTHYANEEQAATERARDLLAKRSGAASDLGRLKRLAAEERGIKIGEDAIDYLLDQLVELLMHSSSVDEVFAEDHVLRLKMRGPLRKVASDEAALDTEVRGRMKHLEEGTGLWDVEYRRVLEDVKRRKGQ